MAREVDESWRTKPRQAFGYVLRGADGRVLYVGITSRSFEARWGEHLAEFDEAQRSGSGRKWWVPFVVPAESDCELLFGGRAVLRGEAEQEWEFPLIRELRPAGNVEENRIVGGEARRRVGLGGDPLRARSAVEPGVVLVFGLWLLRVLAGVGLFLVGLLVVVALTAYYT